MKITKHWYSARQKPPAHQPVLCFNGVCFIGEWDGQQWQASYYQHNPTSPPPSHWRQLPDYQDKWQEEVTELC